jgi:ribosomal protein S27E
MSERKYRQRGYMDEPREPRGRKAEPQKREYAPRGQPPTAPKTFNMPGFREVVKCARCGNELTVATAWSATAQCARCGADLHSCAQCAHFDTSAPFECQQPVPARVSPKDARNECQYFEPRRTVERETTSSSSPQNVSSAKKAFDDLFK